VMLLGEFAGNFMPGYQMIEEDKIIEKTMV
jgi:hypothetical protein